MGKEKVTEEVAKTLGNVSNASNTSNILLQYAPLIIGLLCLVVCYLLFKKIQTLNSHGDSVSKIEKQFTNFVKEQSEVNAINGKKFNAMISQINQLSYIIQNSSSRESNTVVSQMSPERDQGPQGTQGPQRLQGPQGPQDHQVSTQSTETLNPEQTSKQPPVQPPQREMMPTSVIQTNFPMQGDSNSLPTPVSTTIKKEVETLPTIEQQKQQKQGAKGNSKKVIDLQTLKEEVLIEEASSDED
jgi:hypothetical protein